MTNQVTAPIVNHKVRYRVSSVFQGNINQTSLRTTVAHALVVAKHDLRMGALHVTIYDTHDRDAVVWMHSTKQPQLL